MGKTAIYLRVSTDGQSHDPQRGELCDYCSRRKWRDVEEYADVISGAKFTRTGLDRMMAEVRRGKVDRVVVIKLDRLGRSLAHLAQLIAEFDRHQVALIATSQGIDTSHDNPAGRLQMHVLMAVAEFERALISDRTRAGVAAARSRGAKLGRKPTRLNAAQRRAFEEFRSMRAAAISLGERPPGFRQLAEKLGVSLGLAHRLFHREDFPVEA